MQHLLAPSRVATYPSTQARLVRGGSGSATLHAVLVALLMLAGGGGVATLATPAGPRVVRLPSLGASFAAPQRREPESPFREKPDEAPGAIPLTVRNYVTGDEFTI